MKPIKLVAKVTEVVKYGPANLHFKLSLNEEIEFEPGQYVMLLLKDKDGNTARRAYSIASAPKDKKKIELLITLIPGGLASGFFEKLKVGDEINLLGPMGIFKIKEPVSDPVYFIATGCGLAPLRAMVADLLGKGIKSEVVLLYGYRHECDLLDKDYLDHLKRYPNFKSITTISQPKGKIKGHVGRVTALVDEYITPKEDTQVYVCGRPDMIEDMKKLLIKKGIKSENIIYERWK
ncbi:ferredoxin--NADP reductase [Nanoarchaeota archaeon]